MSYDFLCLLWYVISVELSVVEVFIDLYLSSSFTGNLCGSGGTGNIWTLFSIYYRSEQQI